MRRICLDLDGVICELRRTDQSYEDLKPVPGAVERIKDLKENGHYIIISTARRMKTCQANVGKVIADIGKVTLDWLARYEIPYDEIHFGKPWAHIYVDDNAMRFTNWDEIKGDGSSFPLNKELLVRKDEK